MEPPAYPHTMRDFDAFFGSDDDCRAYLAKLRWADGYLCKKCSSSKAWLTKRGLMHCTSCGHQVSPTAGTIFHRNRSPLRTWFQAIWWVVAQKNGVSALGLQRVLGLGSYETAWSWLHKLRRAMVRQGRDKLSGEVEVDESYIGGQKSKAAWHYEKFLVAIAAEVRGDAIGRIRLQMIPSPSKSGLTKFVTENIETGSTLITDGLHDYKRIVKKGYKHDRRVAGHFEPARARVLLPRVHRVAALLKRWLLGTHHGRVERGHIPYYLDEYTFRFNRRSSRRRGLLFFRLLQQAVCTGPTERDDLVGGVYHKVY